MAKKLSSLRRQNRKILPGFPWEGKFQTREEIDEYFSGDQLQCLLCGKWYKQINHFHLSRIHDTTVDEYKERYGLPWSRGLTGESSHEKHVKRGKGLLVDGLIPWTDYRALRKTKKRRRRSVQPFEITNQRLTIEEMRQIARERGGKCLSAKYDGVFTKLLWQCAEGHQWRTTPSCVKSGSWCPSCARDIRKGACLKEMREIARKRGGKCLSATYINKATKLLWECRKGHQWKAMPHNVKHGTWCPICAGNAKGTIKEIQRIARKRGGKCLSATYINMHKKLLWQCSKGHRWKATPNSVKNGSWCPTCAGKAKGTIKEIRQIARQRGGKCLSATYINRHTKLLWQCSKGHRWKATPNSVKNGSWCPTCAANRRRKKRKPSK